MFRWGRHVDVYYCFLSEVSEGFADDIKIWIAYPVENVTSFHLLKTNFYIYIPGHTDKPDKEKTVQIG